MKPSPKADGFTLLEILIALAILAILMIGLIKITTYNTRNLWHIENKTLATLIAGNHAAQLRLAKDKPEQDDGWETQAGRRWYWQARRQITTTLGLWQYRIAVYLEGDKEPYTELISLIPEAYNAETDPPNLDADTTAPQQPNVSEPVMEPDNDATMPPDEPAIDTPAPLQNYE
ncbi:MAG: type II secretion system minor pseudopilin GspI [Methylovulum sp.]|nr:type II secretion system minor pseudopilin GspI [Methylovulum sp.]